MMRIMVASVALVGLAACGGGSQGKNGRGYNAPAVAFAQGPIQRACVSARRKSASSARCGCIQAVANQSLDAGEQRRGAKFFKDPHKAQVTRQSDNPSNEQFWLAWKAFGQRAAAHCGRT